VSFPYFISPEQAMRERSELARKGIARGKSVVALVYAGGVLFVAENPSRSLQKISELYENMVLVKLGANVGNGIAYKEHHVNQEEQPVYIECRQRSSGLFPEKNK